MDGLLVLIVIGLIIAVVVLFNQSRALKQTAGSIQQAYNQLQQQMNQRVQNELNQWQQREVESIRIQERQSAGREAAVLLEQWKAENTTSIRQDAISRSRAVITGQVTEHLMPYLPMFPYNPKDVRFIGSPIDLLVFDGLSDENIQELIFIEIKTSNSRLSHKQKLVKDAVLAKKVVWRELRMEVEKAAH